MAILVSMGERSYRSFFEVVVKSYAEDNVASGRWSAQDALALAQSETERLLPQGHATLAKPIPRFPEDHRDGVDVVPRSP